MPRVTRQSSSESSDEASVGPVGGRGGLRAPSQSSSDEDFPPATNIVFRSSMDPNAPIDFRVELRRATRYLELCFHDLRQDLQQHREETNRHFNEQREETNRRFDNVDRRFDDVDRQFQDIDKRFKNWRRDWKAQQLNRAATRLYSTIEPVGRFDIEDDQMSMPEKFPRRVHQFLRLLQPDKSEVLTSLLRFYDAQSWSTWGILPAWPDDESETELLLAPEHSTLKEAVEFAPEIALQQLAAEIGLDYERIMINREEDLRLQESRKTYGKRVLREESRGEPQQEKREAKRGKPSEAHVRQKTPSAAPVQSEVDLRQFTLSQLVGGFEQPKPEVRSLPSEELGWDCRRTEDRTPPELKPRLRFDYPEPEKETITSQERNRRITENAPPSAQRPRSEQPSSESEPSHHSKVASPLRAGTLSPTSVATSVQAELLARERS